MYHWPERPEISLQGLSEWSVLGSITCGNDDDFKSREDGTRMEQSLVSGGYMS